MRYIQSYGSRGQVRVFNFSLGPFILTYFMAGILAMANSGPNTNGKFYS